MKKLLAVMVIAFAITSCNNSGVDSSAAPSSDSSKMKDSIKNSNDSSMMKKDTGMKDTTKKM